MAPVKTPKKCNICDIVYKHKQSLNRHNEVKHNGICHACEICNKKFGAKSDLNRHISSVHEGKKAFKCDICNIAISSSQRLIYHQQTIKHLKRANEPKKVVVIKIKKKENPKKKKPDAILKNMKTVYRQLFKKS